MAKEKLKAHLIERDWCKGCGICVAFCPKKVLAMDNQDKATAHLPRPSPDNSAIVAPSISLMAM